MSSGEANWEGRLSRTFVGLADTLVRDFDVVDVLDELVSSCLDLLNASAAGLVLADPGGRLRVMASSSEQTRLLELFELQNDQGPCLDCYRTGVMVREEDSAALSRRWPAFASEAFALGFGIAYALPMRLRDETIGALNLFAQSGAPLRDTDLEVGQALADVATIAVLHHRALRRSTELAAQLQTALNSRVSIEQAKGVIAERRQVDMDEAFVRLRAYARSHQVRLSDAANLIIQNRGEDTMLGLPPDPG
jgi:GAF domain-containing protein